MSVDEEVLARLRELRANMPWMPPVMDTHEQPSVEVIDNDTNMPRCTQCATMDRVALETLRACDALDAYCGTRDRNYITAVCQLASDAVERVAELEATLATLKAD